MRNSGTRTLPGCTRRWSPLLDGATAPLRPRMARVPAEDGPTGITVDTSADVLLPDGWEVEIRPGSAIGDVTVAPKSVS